MAAIVAGCLSPSCTGASVIESVVRLEDVSASVEPRRGASPDDDVAAHLEVADGVRPVAVGAPALFRDRSRLAEGLAAAGAALGGLPGAIRLRTDGRDTEGGVVGAARALARAGHRVFVEAPAPAPADVALASVQVTSAASGSAIEFAVDVASSVAGRARVALFRDGAERDARIVELSPGSPTRVRLVDAAVRRASDVFEVNLTPEDGTPNDDRANDRVRFEVPGETARVVIVGDGTAPAMVEGGLRLAHVASIVDVDFDTTDLVVLSDVPARALRNPGLEDLARFVAGGGVLLVLGGEDAYGPGGVAGTAYERLLALRPRHADGERVACVVALDRSGSTAEGSGASTRAIDDLRRAVRALVRGLPGGTLVRVLPFADAPDPPIPPGDAWGADDGPARDSLLAALERVVPSGGTDLARAVTGAIDLATMATDVRRRRVFLLTDGDPDHPLAPTSFAAQRARLDASGVEFSAIVRGDEAAAVALRALAARPADVVRIEASDDFPEALLRTFDRGRARDEIAAGLFVPVAADDGSDAIAAAAAKPSRVHRLEPADDARVLARATAPDGESLPIVAVRRFGAGRVAGHAGGFALEAGEARASFLDALRPFLERLARAADRGLAARRDGGRLWVEAPPGLGSLAISTGDGTASAVLLEAENGVYVGDLAPEVPHDAVLTAVVRPGETRALRLPFSPPIEHRGAGLDLDALRAIAEAGDGRRVREDEPTPRRRRTTNVDLAPYCFGMAVLLLVVDRVLDRARPAPGVAS